jgi:hypothetical protein
MKKVGVPSTTLETSPVVSVVDEGDPSSGEVHQGTTKSSRVVLGLPGVRRDVEDS